MCELRAKFDVLSLRSVWKRVGAHLSVKHHRFGQEISVESLIRLRLPRRSKSEALCQRCGDALCRLIGRLEGDELHFEDQGRARRDGLAATYGAMRSANMTKQTVRFRIP